MSESEVTSSGGEGREGSPAALSHWITKQANGITRLKLETPVTFGSETMTELLVRPATAKQLRLINGEDQSPGQFLVMAEELCGLTKNQIDTIGVRDSLRLVELIASDFGDGPAAGGS